MKHVLVTGGAGYIGSVLVPNLLKNNYKVTVIDNLYFNQVSLMHLCNDKNFNFIYGDVCDIKIIRDNIKDKDIIIPLAALVGAPICDKHPELAKEVNLESIKKISDIISKNQILIIPTTNSGYGVGKKDEFCDENSPLNPISLYGRTKVDAEKIVMDRENSISLRLATVFGPSQRMRLDLLVNDFTFKAYKSHHLELFEPNFRRNFIHIDDVVYAFIYCLQNFENMKSNVYNTGLSSANLTKLQLANKIKKYIPELEITINNFSKDPDKRDYLVSNEKLEQKGWFPNKNLDDGIMDLLRLFSMIKNQNFSNV